MTRQAKGEYHPITYLFFSTDITLFPTSAHLWYVHVNLQCDWIMGYMGLDWDWEKSMMG